MLDDGPQRCGKVSIDGRIRREFFEKPAQCVSGIMIRTARAARLRNRREPLVAGGCQQCLSRRETAVKRADPDLCSLRHLLQRNACTTLKEQFFCCDEDALTVPFCINA
ncbi:hypothetical protein ASF24_18965 [Methylobacterium sp. Leaf86]|nr:hypothetical protein ASF24_18965 [Methylobacterium sp. Leaf86]